MKLFEIRPDQGSLGKSLFFGDMFVFLSLTCMIYVQGEASFYPDFIQNYFLLKRMFGFFDT